MKYYVALTFLLLTSTLKAEESKNLFITCKIENVSYLIQMNSDTLSIKIQSEIFPSKSRRVLNQFTAYNKKYLLFSKHLFEQNQIYLFKIISLKEFDDTESIPITLMILNLENDQINYKNGFCDLALPKGNN